MQAGDTLTLMSSCISLPMSANTYHDWSSLPQFPNTFVTTFQPTARVFPLTNTLYTYRRTANITSHSCSAEQQIFVRVTATDDDQDGFPYFLDCNDQNANVNPAAIEIPFNGLDDDCEDGDDGFCIIRQPGSLHGSDALVQSDSTNKNAGFNDDLNVAYSDFTSVTQHQVLP